MKIIQIIPVITLEEQENGHIMSKTSIAGLSDEGGVYYYMPEEISTWKEANKFHKELKAKQKFLELAEKEVK